ncbi:MAG: hypothetical protein ACI86C_000768 [Candidatus Latescibacterota bacterium]|jgi:hypothetical protein
MKIDLYTKSILTIIAICLSISVVQQFDIIPRAYAAGDKLTPELETQYRLVPINEFETIDVRIVDINTYDELNVNLKSIDTSDELDVNLDEIGGGWVTNGGPIKVKIE